MEKLYEPRTGHVPGVRGLVRAVRGDVATREIEVEIDGGTTNPPGATSTRVVSVDDFHLDPLPQRTVYGQPFHAMWPPRYTHCQRCHAPLAEFAYFGPLADPTDAPGRAVVVGYCIPCARTL